MQAPGVNLRVAFGTRLCDLNEWLLGALEIGEQRDAESVRVATNALLHWLYETWDDNAGDVSGALESAALRYVEVCTVWVRDTAMLETDLSIKAEPAWTIPEFHLVFALVLAQQALLAFQRGAKECLFLSAILYADAIEVREHWDHLRGPAGARNPDTWRGKIHAAVLEFDARIAEKKAGTKMAQRGIKRKLQNDPKQAAKMEILKMYEDWQAGKAIYASGAAFARHVVATTVILDTGTVQRWMSQWSKDNGRNR